MTDLYSAGPNVDPAPYIPCDLCETGNPRFILNSRGLDGPLVECVKCGFRYVGTRHPRWHFGKQSSEDTARRSVRQPGFRYLRLEEEAPACAAQPKWRLDLIRQMKPSENCRKSNCARRFLRPAREWFDISASAESGTRRRPARAPSFGTLSNARRGPVRYCGQLSRDRARRFPTQLPPPQPTAQARRVDGN